MCCRLPVLDLARGNVANELCQLKRIARAFEALDGHDTASTQRIVPLLMSSQSK